MASLRPSAEDPTAGSVSRRTPSRRTVVALLAVVGSVVAGGVVWSLRPGGPLTQGAGLQALRDDPMGAQTILGHEAVDSAESSPSGPLSKTTDVWLRRWFRDEGSTPQALQRELIDHALANGWTQEPASTTEGSWSATRTDEGTGTELGLLIVLETDYSPSDLRYLTVLVSLRCI